MKPEKFSLEHEVPDYGDSILTPTPEYSGDKKQKMKKQHPTVHIYHGQIPKGLKPGHKVVLHGVVKSVERSERLRDGEEPKDDANFGVELHHMEHHISDDRSSGPSSDESDIEEGLSKAESRQKKK